VSSSARPARLEALVAPLFVGSGIDGPARAAQLAGRLDRRAFLRNGGAALLGAAVLGACSKAHGHAPSSPGGPTPSTTTTSSVAARFNESDIKILRTLSSLEHYAVGLYVTASGSGLVKAPAVGDVVKFFADEHSAHGGALEGATRAAGGEPFTQANPVVTAKLAPRVTAWRSQQDVARLLYDLEEMLTATYVAIGGAFVDNSLNAAATAVSGAEASHAAVWGTWFSGAVADAPVGVDATALAVPVDGFAPTAGAVVAGSGV